ncbi:MAG: hypothetical protein JXA08_03675, partial [Methanomicrobiaceae archaeon]|nr:hypothetical protein [Methanomicrobiaceae archaeon]
MAFPTIVCWFPSWPVHPAARIPAHTIIPIMKNTFNLFHNTITQPIQTGVFEIAPEKFSHNILSE